MSIGATQRVGVVRRVGDHLTYKGVGQAVDRRLGLRTAALAEAAG